MNEADPYPHYPPPPPCFCFFFRFVSPRYPLNGRSLCFKRWGHWCWFSWSGVPYRFFTLPSSPDFPPPPKLLSIYSIPFLLFFIFRHCADIFFPICERSLSHAFLIGRPSLSMPLVYSGAGHVVILIPAAFGLFGSASKCSPAPRHL